MTKVILHIGLNKTGTSSLQDYLALNRDLLINEGICYPRAASDGAAHHPLSAWVRRQKASVDLGDPFVTNLFDEIKTSSLAIFSSEDFHTLRDIKKVASLFSGYEVKVVLYLREHLSYLASWYQQDVQQTNLSCGFGSYCYLNVKPLHKIADAWVEVFGKRNVDVLLYDRTRLVSGDIVADFMSLVGVNSLDKFSRKPYEENPSVTGNLLFIKRVFNNFIHLSDAEKCTDEMAELSKLDPSFRGRMYVPADLVSYILSNYRADRVRLKNDYGIEINELSGDYLGSLTPDFETLRDHWDLVMHESHERGYSLARASNYFSMLPQGHVI